MLCFDESHPHPIGGGSVAVPLFAMIYGDYALSYGPICCFPDNLDRFEFNYIRNILWGMIPSIEAGELSELENQKDFLDVIKRGTDFFKANKEDIIYGRLLEIPKYSCDTYDITWQGTSEVNPPEVYEFTQSVPKVCAVIWLDAQNNKKLYAYNYSDKKSVIEIDGKKYEIDAKNFFVENL